MHARRGRLRLGRHGGGYRAANAILADLADAVLVIGVEVQNTVKAIYGADILAGAGHYSRERKNGHAYFFPNLFSDRAGAYYEKCGQEETRKGMAEWYALAVENARSNPKAQEHHNADPGPPRHGHDAAQRQGVPRAHQRLRLLQGDRRRVGADPGLRGGAGEARRGARTRPR